MIYIYFPQSSDLGVSASYLRYLCETLPPTLQTWELKNEIVVPSTKARQCCYVDILESKFVKKANVFVSHAYSYLVADTIEVMLRYEDSHPGSDAVQALHDLICQLAEARCA